MNKLTRNVKKEHIAEIFGTYGKVDNVELVINRQTLLPRGFAYVHFAKREEAELALAEMNGVRKHEDETRRAEIYLFFFCC